MFKGRVITYSFKFLFIITYFGIGFTSNLLGIIFFEGICTPLFWDKWRGYCLNYVFLSWKNTAISRLFFSLLIDFSFEQLLLSFIERGCCGWWCNKQKHEQRSNWQLNLRFIRAGLILVNYWCRNKQQIEGGHDGST